MMGAEIGTTGGTRYSRERCSVALGLPTLNITIFAYAPRRVRGGPTTRRDRVGGSVAGAEAMQGTTKGAGTTMGATIGPIAGGIAGRTPRVIGGARRGVPIGGSLARGGWCCGLGTITIEVVGF